LNLSGTSLHQGPRARLLTFFLLWRHGLSAIWTSHPSIFILAGIGLTLVFDTLSRKAYSASCLTLGIGRLVDNCTGGCFTCLSLAISDRRYCPAENYSRRGFTAIKPPSGVTSTGLANLIYCCWMPAWALISGTLRLLVLLWH